eukprot:m.899980 g.899980  ORF g.899980 m.899980 type:complete len:571 (+) comp23684_c0_seq7:2226-3938(+)
MVYDRFEWADAVNASLPGHELVVCELLQWITDSFNERCNDVAHPPGPPIGLILHGCSGTGKSALCSTLVQHKPATIQAVYIQGEEIYQHEDPMAAINSSIASCEADKPTLLIVDNISSMCPVNSKHDTIGNSRVEDTVVEQLSYLLDSWRDAAWSPEVLCSTTMETKATIPIASSKQLFVLGTTTRVESVHPSIRRMDRLGLFVHLQAPSRSARKDILHGIVGCNHVPGQYPNDDILEHIAGTTPGYLPADLKLLHAEAVLEAVKEADSLDLANDSRTKHLPACLAPPTLAHYTTALHRCRPAHLSDISGSLLRPVSFDDLGGLDEIIDDVAFMAQLCFDRKTECDRRGIRPPQGVLILGSAGVGKTQLAMAVAHSQQVNVVPIVATAIRAKVVGQAEAALQALFRKAIESEPCVLLLDQIDAIAARRPEGGQGGAQERLLTCLKTLIDQCFEKASMHQIMIIGTCQDLATLDADIVRAGRLDTHVHIPVPNAHARASILRGKLGRMPGAVHLIGSPAFRTVVDEGTGLSGADLDNICREAAILTLRDNIAQESVLEMHLVAAFKAHRRS